MLIELTCIHLSIVPHYNTVANWQLLLRWSKSILTLYEHMATHCGLAQAIKVLKQDVSRSALQGWRKEAIVDAFISLARCAGAVPGLQQHLESAHKLAVASPAKGGGMEAAMGHLRAIGQQPNACVNGDSSGDDDSTNSGDGGSGDPVAADQDQEKLTSMSPVLQPSAADALVATLACAGPTGGATYALMTPASGSTRNTAFCAHATHNVTLTACNGTLVHGLPQT